MSILDNQKQIKKIDKSQMAKFISELPDQCLKAYDLAQKLKVPADWSNLLENIVICGMGGSAISGNLVKKLKPKIPISLIREYQLPESVNNKSLAIIISFSGNTQETLSCFEQALKRKAKIVAITTGGKLAQRILKLRSSEEVRSLARDKSRTVPIFQFNYPSPPRAGLGWLFIGLTCILAELGVVKIDGLKKNLQLLKKFSKTLSPEVKIKKNPAKYLAYFTYDHIPLIISAEHLGPVACRWKDQLAENSKNFAFAEKAPEIFHNRVVGLEFPRRIKDKVVVLLLDSPLYRVEMKKGLKAFEKLLEKEKIQYWVVPSMDQNRFLDMLWAILIGDWLSFYLAILNGVDPTPTANIESMKRKIKK